MPSAALAWEWRDWCEFHYIVDPDSFFGEHADYLMSVLTQPGYAEMPDPRMMRFTAMSGGFMPMGNGGGDEEGEGSKAWRLLVLEDTGELLTPDAKAVIGQGLSRFLNVVDGLIGQGLRVAGPRDDERADQDAAPGRRQARPVCREHRVLAADGRGVVYLVRAARVRGALGRAAPAGRALRRLEGRDVGSPSRAGFAG